MTQDPLFLVSINLLLAFVARCLSRNLLTAVVLAVVVILCGGYLGSHHNGEILAALNSARDYVLEPSVAETIWPPVVGQAYPDFQLVDQDGRLRRLSEFRGKVILIEPVGMSCPACVAFSGGHALGAFEGTPPQPNLDGIEFYVERFAQVAMDDPDLVFVQLVLFNSQMAAPTADEVSRWADHFGLQSERNQLVLAGTQRHTDAAGHALIPGFQLIDRDFVLRFDSTGHQPQHDLYRELLPQLRPLLDR